MTTTPRFTRLKPMRFYKPVLLAAFGLLLFDACKKDDADEREPCLQPQVMVLKAVTRRRADTGTATLDTLLPFPLARPLSGLPKQYVYVPGRTSSFSWPLSQVADSCRWSLQPDSTGLLDTLTFYYDRQLRFLSNACGYATFYDIRRVTTTNNAIDSVILMERSVTNDVSPVNLRIYY